MSGLVRKSQRLKSKLKTCCDLSQQVFCRFKYLLVFMRIRIIASGKYGDKECQAHA